MSKNQTEEKTILEEQLHDAYTRLTDAENSRDILMQQVSELNKIKRDQKVENFELLKTVKRLTLSQANEAVFFEIDEIQEKGLKKDSKANYEEEKKAFSAKEKKIDIRNT